MIREPAEPRELVDGPSDELDDEDLAAIQRDKDEEADARAESNESTRDYEDENGWDY